MLLFFNSQSNKTVTVTTQKRVTRRVKKQAEGCYQITTVIQTGHSTNRTDIYVSDRLAAIDLTYGKIHETRVQYPHANVIISLFDIKARDRKILINYHKDVQLKKEVLDDLLIIRIK